MENQKTNPSQPTHEPFAEAVIIVGAILLFLYPILLLLSWLFLNVFAGMSPDQESNKTDMQFFSLLPILAVSCLAQAPLLLLDRYRVDHYRARILAIAAILSFPILSTTLVNITTKIVELWLSSNGNLSALDDPNSFASQISTFPIYGALILSVIGSLWLWILMFQRNKLFWRPDGSIVAKGTMIQTSTQPLKTRIINNCLIFGPIVIIGLFFVLALSSRRLTGNEYSLLDTWISTFLSPPLIYIIVILLLASMVFGSMRRKNM